MIEPFCSVYTKNYRAFEREPQLEAVKSCIYYKDLGENFLPLEDSKTMYNPERDKNVIKELYLRRYVSIYQDSYCKSEGKRSMVIDPNNLEEDQFMAYFNKYYAEKRQPVPRPLETARRIYGYSRFSNYYTGMSEVQDTIYRAAYEYFKKDFDKGKSRLFYKKQKAIQEAREKAKTGDKGKEVKEEEQDKEKDEREKKEANGVTGTAGKPQKQLSKEKICQICGEKYGNFCYPPRDCQNAEN